MILRPVAPRMGHEANVIASGYSFQKRELVIEFKRSSKGRGVYIYSNVEPALAKSIITAPSVGSTLQGLVVKFPDVYPYRKVVGDELKNFAIERDPHCVFVWFEKLMEEPTEVKANV